ncbi:hypothetical protein [Streptomyces varsoviensis]|uniref:hypothetical protein n=1 Tax=Streptomyces varsoviensis TaxID=67373 RepID=UPI000A7EFBA6|nr:hypothetical protein [Streptomyces varsoviensis]
MGFPDGKAFVIRHRSSNLYLAAQSGDAVKLRPQEAAARAELIWTCKGGRLSNRHYNKALDFDQKDRCVLRLGPLDGSEPVWVYEGDRINAAGFGDTICLAPAGNGNARLAGASEISSGFVDVSFDIFPADWKVQKNDDLVFEETDGYLEKYLDYFNAAMKTGIETIFSLGKVPGGSAVSFLWDKFFSWWRGQIYQEVTLEDKLNKIVEWTKVYVAKEISDVVKNDILAAYKTFQEHAVPYTTALTEYKNAKPEDKDYWRKRVNDEYGFVAQGARTILSKCESQSSEKGGETLVFIYCLTMSLYCTAVRDRLIFHQEWGLKPPEVGDLKNQLSTTAWDFFVNMQKILFELPLLYYYQGSAGRTDSLIGKDPTGNNKLDTQHTLSGIMKVMRVMRGHAYMNPRRYKNEIKPVQGTGTIDKKGLDLQIRPNLPETTILQPFHLGSERLPQKATSPYSVKASIDRDKADTEQFTIRCLFASVHSDHPSQGNAGDPIPDQIKLNGTSITGHPMEAEKEVKYRIIHDTRDNNNTFWNRTGVKQGFDKENYVRYVYMDFGTHDFEKKGQYTLEFPAGSRLCAADICFVTPDEKPVDPVSEFVLDVDGNPVNPQDDYYLVLLSSSSTYLSVSDDKKKLLLVTSAPKQQVRISKKDFKPPYDKLAYNEPFSVAFQNKYDVGWGQVRLRLNANGELYSGDPAQFYQHTEIGLLQLEGSKKKLAQKEGVPGRVVLSETGENDYLWAFKKFL